MKKQNLLDLVNAIAAIVAIAAGVTLFLIGLCEETPWRMLFVDMTVLVISALVMRLTSDGMNFSEDVDELDIY